MIETRLAWDDPALQIASDSKRTARYRMLQSWYRQHMLNDAPYGEYLGRPVGSLLDPGAVDADPSLNFLSQEAWKYAKHRAPQVRASGGSLEPGRLFHNMLSSMPLCFSVFGHLRALDDRGLEIVRALFDPQATEVLEIECEWKPETNHLGDRTAFDAMILTRRAGGDTHLVGVETKYTEPFSAKPYLRSEYLEVQKASGQFHEGTCKSLVGSSTNQLWRNTLLAVACELYEPGVDSASIAILSLSEDEGVKKAMAGLGARTVNEICTAVTLEDLVKVARRTPGLGDWAERLGRRYVDLSPLARS